uniref:Uncharacterized protein n=1 Tax=Astatotilapia calliptera TaxID=8154 RepID=A0A3P8PSM8_ASTCA
VMEPTSPVDGDVCLLLVQLHCSKLTKLEETIKDWTVLSNIDCKKEKTKNSALTSLHLFAVLRHVVRSDGPQELNVIITVVLCHLFTTDLHFSVQSIVEEEVVRHTDPVWFHGMALAIVVIPHITCGQKHHPDKFILDIAKKKKERKKSHIALGILVLLKMPNSSSAQPKTCSSAFQIHL